MTIDYTFGRDPHNGLKAKTIVSLGDDTRRELHIETSKRTCGGIETNATVFTRTEDGQGLEHAFGLRRPGSGDYRSPLRRADARCTEKAVRALHESVTADNLHALLNEVRDYYVAQDAITGRV